IDPRPRGPRIHPPARCAIVRCLNPLPGAPEADRILVVRLGAVGDVVRTLPAASALRAAYPGSHLAWLVERASASLLRAQPWLDEVIEFPREELRDALRRGRLLAAGRTARRFARGLRRRGFELVVDFHGILKSGALAAASGARVRASYARPYARELSWLFANERAALWPPRASRFERNDALVRFLGVSAPAAAQPLRVDAERLRRIEGELGAGPPPVAIHPGTSDSTPHKRWNAAGYAAVARTLHAKRGVRSVITVGPARDDRAFAEAVVAESAGAAALAPATPSLADLAALFARSRLYIGSDTGPMHVASLVGTPVLQLLGPTDPVENAPWTGTPSRTLRIPVACSPCRRGCAAALCMQLHAPDAVAREALALLASHGGGC
ncbi:MAG TPA: glycosyltransferase family 9 protein, partial [Myxococcota bacterium]|nr:glycosyltransferase family 9 protein [Myxococcota bacterium]